MKKAALYIILGAAGVIGCVSNNHEVYVANGYEIDGVVRGYKIVAQKVVKTPEGDFRVPSYEIGAYNPDPKKYGISTYNARETRAFLASVQSTHGINDIIVVDDLKWKLVSMNGVKGWLPYPNPPTPKLEKGEDRGKHCREYAEWIDNHPHFGLPPLPMPEKN